MRYARAAAVAAIAFLGAWAWWWEPSRPQVNRYVIALPGWPPALDGLRILHLSDLHVGAPWVGLPRLRELVARGNALQPDLVVLTGDFVIDDVLGGSFVPPEDIGRELAALRAPLGAFAVLGNHDEWLGAERVRSALEAGGITVLEDRSILLAHHGAAFRLAGVGDFWESPHDWRKALAGAGTEPVILATHNPDLFPELPASVTLTLAGHTPGGQVNLPFVGRLVVPSQHGQRYAEGVVTQAGKTLFVSRGIGTSILPVRFRAPPEIALLHVHAAD